MQPFQRQISPLAERQVVAQTVSKRIFEALEFFIR